MLHCLRTQPSLPSLSTCLGGSPESQLLPGVAFLDIVVTAINQHQSTSTSIFTAINQSTVINQSTSINQLLNDFGPHMTPSEVSQSILEAPGDSTKMRAARQQTQELRAVALRGTVIGRSFSGSSGPWDHGFWRSSAGGDLAKQNERCSPPEMEIHS